MITQRHYLGLIVKSHSFHHSPGAANHRRMNVKNKFKSLMYSSTHTAEIFPLVWTEKHRGKSVTGQCDGSLNIFTTLRTLLSSHTAPEPEEGLRTFYLKGQAAIQIVLILSVQVFRFPSLQLLPPPQYNAPSTEYTENSFYGNIFFGEEKVVSRETVRV